MKMCQIVFVNDQWHSLKVSIIQAELVELWWCYSDNTEKVTKYSFRPNLLVILGIS
jgi:hypothetical protein